MLLILFFYSGSNVKVIKKGEVIFRFDNILIIFIFKDVLIKEVIKKKISFNIIYGIFLYTVV